MSLLITEKEAEHLYQKMKQGVELTEDEIKEIILVMVYELTEFVHENKKDTVSNEEYEKIYEEAVKAGTHPVRWWSAAQANTKNLIGIHPFVKLLIIPAIYGVYPPPLLKKG